MGEKAFSIREMIQGKKQGTMGLMKKRRPPIRYEQGPTHHRHPQDCQAFQQEGCQDVCPDHIFTKSGDSEFEADLTHKKNVARRRLLSGLSSERLPGSLLTRSESWSC